MEAQVLCFDVKQWMDAHPARECPPALLAQPVQLGVGWSKDGEHFEHENCSQLQALNLPELPCSLDAGMELYNAKQPVKAGLEIVIRQLLASGAGLAECDVLTFRNNLNKILGTAADVQNPWAVDACCLTGTLFLDIVQEEEEDKFSLTSTGQRFTAWGYQFEALCTGQAGADPNCEYAALIRTKLAQQRLFVGAEIDAYDPDVAAPAEGTAPQLASFVEMKTYREPQHAGQRRTLYARKHPKWWVQSFLAGVPTLVLGARDDQGWVRSIHRVRTADLPKISWQNGHPWHPDQILFFGSACLEWMAGVARQLEGQHLRFAYCPQRQQITAQVVEGGDLPARLQAVLPPA